MIRYFLIINSLILFVATGCIGPSRALTESRAVSNFDAVDFKTGGKMTILPGADESLSIETDSATMSRVSTQVQNGKLTIWFSEEPALNSIFPKAIHYTLAVKNLASLNVEGNGMIDLKNLNAGSLEVTIRGSGNVTVEGRVVTQQLLIDGMGIYKAENLKSQQARVKVGGNGLATVWASDRLEAEISGLATKVQYYGNPQITQSISGGQLISMGTK